MLIVPPGSGIVHQVNLEYLARVVFDSEGVLYPDSLVGTDSHTTMINGLGVVGWGKIFYSTNTNFCVKSYRKRLVSIAPHFCIYSFIHCTSAPLLYVYNLGCMMQSMNWKAMREFASLKLRDIESVKFKTCEEKVIRYKSSSFGTSIMWRFQYNRCILQSHNKCGKNRWHFSNTNPFPFTYSLFYLQCWLFCFCQVLAV